MFHPWVGKHFGAASNSIGGVKLLIIGESHYTEKNELVGTCIPSDTFDVINQMAIKDRYKFHGKVANLATGENVTAWTDEQNESFWNSVAFYNYVPEFLSKGGRPTKSAWQAGEEPLRKVLADIEPEAIIVCGLETWWYVMNSLPGGVFKNPPERDVAQIGTAVGVRIPHPTGARGASRYTYAASRPLVELMLSDARQLREAHRETTS